MPLRKEVCRGEEQNVLMQWRESSVRPEVSLMRTV